MARENQKFIDPKTKEVIYKSRSVAVVACLVTLNPETKEYNFLLERRGEGCPDHVGELAFPCGYLNWDETRKEAVIREVQEELGLYIPEDTISEWKTIDDPNHDERQNVVTRYIIPLDYDDISEWIKTVDLNSEERGGEKNEVSEVLLLPYSEIDKEDKWAFGHHEVIEELVSVLNIYIDEDDISSIVDEEAVDPDETGAETNESTAENLPEGEEKKPAAIASEE